MAASSFSSAVLLLVLTISPLLSHCAKEFVLTLDDKNFDKEIQKHDFMLVEFYAPWCGHCKQLAPEYEKAAKALKKEGSNIVLAKVDADEASNKPLAEKYGVQGFPTLKIFRKGSSTVEDYDGPREADGIVSHVKKLAGPASQEVKTAKEVEAFLAANPVAAVGLFKDFKSEEFRNYLIVANTLRSALSLAHTKDASILPEKGTPLVAPAVRLFKNFDEGFNDFTALDVVSLTAGLEAKSLPLVAEMSRDEAAMRALNKIFESEKSKSLLFLEYASEDKAAYSDAYRTLAATMPDLNFIIGDGKDNDHALKYFGVTLEDLPALLIHDTPKDKKYVKSKVEISEMAAFLDDFQKGVLAPTVKSQPVPATNDGPVTVLVGTNFDDIVFKTGKNVLIEFYAPWCGHCKKLAPIYEQVGEVFQEDDDVIIAKFDADGNDVPSKQFNIKGFPTLFFVNAQGEVTLYEGGRKKKEMIAYVKKNKTTPSLADSIEKSVEETAEAAEAVLEAAAEGVKEAVGGEVKDEL